MTTFIIGLIILIVGGYFYGKYCEKVFGPDDRTTPAIEKADGIDYVGMSKWKNGLIELLNIAGTGPILGPIQGVLFGPIAFITIPIGCVIAGSMHDYFVGMLSMRNGGDQMPKMIRKYLGEKTYKIYNVVVWILLLLVGTVFIYTPGDLIVSDILGQQPTIDNPVLWIVYAAIFAYYIASTVFPIDKIIGKVYPIFGAILVLSAIGIFGGILLDGGVNLTNLSLSANILGQHPSKLSFFPVFFITVACGIMSGFHSTQSTLISRTVTDEREGRSTFFNMMLVEGFIAMVWAAGAMVLFNLGTAVDTNATLMVGMISRHFLGNIGALFAILGVIVLPITSGDTAFRSLRLTLAETFNIDQSTNKNRMGISVIIFAIAAVILVYSKSSPGGFSLLWRYFGFTNQLIAVFALAMIAIYLAGKNKNYWISLLPGVFYCMVVVSYILHEPIGFGLESRIGYLFGLDPNSYSLSLILGAIIAIIYGWVVMKAGKKRATNNLGKLNL